MHAVQGVARPGELLAEGGRVPGVRAEGLDVAAVLARRDEVIHDLDDSVQVPWLEERGVSWFAGAESSTARGASVSATTCSRPAGRRDRDRERRRDAADPGAEGGASVGKPEATTAKEAPESLVILGGGVVGVKLAQAWASLGTGAVVEGAPG